MRDLASNKDHKVTFAQEGGLRSLIAVAREDDLQLQILAVGALRHLSLSTRIKRPIVVEGALGPIFDCSLRDTASARPGSASGENMRQNATEIDLLSHARARWRTSPRIPRTRSRSCATARLDRSCSSRGPNTAGSSRMPREHCAPSRRIRRIRSASLGQDELRALFHLGARSRRTAGVTRRSPSATSRPSPRIRFRWSRLGVLPPLIELMSSEFTSCQQFARARCTASRRASRISRASWTRAASSPSSSSAARPTTKCSVLSRWLFATSARTRTTSQRW